jgi:DNA-binding transcriptional ArsR family regulator
MTDQSAAFAALGDPTRRAIFERVARRPQSVGKLAEQFSVSRPAVSQHLRVLKDAGLVSDRQEGARRIYAIDMSGVRAMRSYLDKFWDRALSSFEAVANQEEEEESQE